MLFIYKYIVNTKGANMKKLSFMLILVLFLTSSSILFCQNDVSSRGLFGGVNFANVSGDDIENNEQITGYRIGGFVTKQLGQKFQLQFEGMYSTKGWLIKYDYQDDNYSNRRHYIENEISLSYIQLGMLGRVVDAVNNNVDISMLFGPLVGLNTYAHYDNKHVKKHTYQGEVDTEIFKEDGDINDVNSLDFGLAFGFGLTVYNVILDARYEMGLSNVYDTEMDFEAKNSVLSLMIGYSF